MEDWLYEDGEDETKGVYIAKLEELKKVACVSFVFFFPSDSVTGFIYDLEFKIVSKEIPLRSATRSILRGDR